MKILCCIPARYQSSRLPGKPLLKINGISIIQHVYNQALKTKSDDIIVLTDDTRIYDEVISFNGKCTLITDYCLNGTDRIVHYLNRIDHTEYDAILNIQGDEPFINPKHVDAAIDNYFETYPTCSTICFKTQDKSEILSKSRGKSVTNMNNDIMYCSRNVIPTNKVNDIIPEHVYNIHVGIFVYNKKYLLEEYSKEDTPLQLAEDIEWMKMLERGFRINTIFVEHAERGVDTSEDYKYLCEKYDNI